MSSFRVDLDDPPKGKFESAPMFAASRVPKRRSRRPFVIVAGVLAAIALLTFVGGFLYWQSLKSTPQYSLALLVDAAKHDDQKTIGEIVDIDAVVDDFVPQIMDKAVELYGRGLPPQILGRVAMLATPLLPAIKERAKAELPRVIRDRTERFGNVPFFAMVLGADRFLDITITGETAVVKSKLPEHPLEMKMRRNGMRWQITGIKDEKLATDIARKIGQEIVMIATNGLNQKTADTLGVGNLADLLRQAEDLVK